VSRDEMRHLKLSIGWGGRKYHVPTSLKVLVGVLAALTIVFSTLYVIELLSK
jgi:hypothetical protein